MVQELKKQNIYQLSKFIFLFFPLFLWGFTNLYRLNYDNFEVTTKRDSYKLVLKSQHYLDYTQIKGFKFFIPYFTEEFVLKILRFNSVGYINGILSMDNQFRRVLSISPENFEYYITDYKDSGRQLDYLLKYQSIPYKQVTSISFEIYNIPFRVAKNLNRYIYFKKEPLKNNNLKHILFSVTLKLDKKLVDRYVVTHYPYSQNYIKTFLDNIYKIQFVTNNREIDKKVNNRNIYRKIEKKSEEKKESQKKLSYKLKLHRFLFMYDYGIENENYENSKYIKQLETINHNFQVDFNKSLILQANLASKAYFEQFKEVIDELKFNNHCNFAKNRVIKSCFKNKNYFRKYIYFAIKNGSLAKNNIIIAYGDYKIFNDIAKYFFEIGAFKKAELYLQKASVLAPNETTIIHNLAVLYATPSELYNIKKAIRYFKKSKMFIDYYNLGVYYYIGLGVKESDKIARNYFKKAYYKVPYARFNYNIMKKYKIGLR